MRVETSSKKCGLSYYANEATKAAPREHFELGLKEICQPLSPAPSANGKALGFRGASRVSV